MPSSHYTRGVGWCVDSRHPAALRSFHQPPREAVLKPAAPLKLLCHGTGSGPRSLTSAGVGARAPLAAVPNRFKHSPEEFFGGQDPDHLGSCLLKDFRKLCEIEKMNEEEQIIKCSKHKLKAG